jgi:hypothetical protein
LYRVRASGAPFQGRPLEEVGGRTVAKPRPLVKDTRISARPSPFALTTARDEKRGRIDG